jgi:hypothetical protein
MGSLLAFAAHGSKVGYLGSATDFAKPAFCALLPLNPVEPLGVPDGNYQMTAVSPKRLYPE